MKHYLVLGDREPESLDEARREIKKLRREKQALQAEVLEQRRELGQKDQLLKVWQLKKSEKVEVKRLQQGKKRRKRKPFIELSKFSSLY